MSSLFANDYALFAAGVGLAAILMFVLNLMRQEEERVLGQSWSRPRGPESPLEVKPGEVFDPKVLLLEFNEHGASITVNGKFFNSFERLEMDMVVAEVDSGGKITELVSPAEVDEDILAKKCCGNLVYFLSHTTIHEDQTGMFSAPLMDPEAGDLIGKELDKIDDMANLMVERMDRELGSYSLDEESFGKIAQSFLAEFAVRDHLAVIEDLCIWREGALSVTVLFLDPDDSVVDETALHVRLEREEAEALRRNIKLMAENSLRAELGLELVEYSAVAFERP